MFELILLAATITLMILFSNINNREEVVYSGSESNLNEANEYYWLLKSNRIPVKYNIPYNWENFYRFGYKESPVYIKVDKKNAEKANKVMMFYRAEKKKMERNMEAERNKRNISKDAEN